MSTTEAVFVALFIIVVMFLIGFLIFHFLLFEHLINILKHQSWWVHNDNVKDSLYWFIVACWLLGIIRSSNATVSNKK